MEEFVKGDIVVLPFPFSDLSASKRRPALIISILRGNDVILCQITSKAKFDAYAISLSDKDFAKAFGGNCTHDLALIVFILEKYQGHAPLTELRRHMKQICVIVFISFDSKILETVK